MMTMKTMNGAALWWTFLPMNGKSDKSVSTTPEEEVTRNELCLEMSCL